MNDSKKSQRKQAKLTDTLQPSNLDAEKALLGCILAEPDSLKYVKDTLTALDFYSPRHQKIYQYIVDMDEQGYPVDPITIADFAKQNGIEEIEVSYLSNLMDMILTAGNIGYYADILTTLSRKRDLIQAGQKLEMLGRDSDMSLEQALADAEKMLGRLTIDSKAIVARPLKELLDVESEPQVIKGLLPRGGGLILAAESGMGKSLILLDWAFSLATGEKIWGRFEILGPLNILILQTENSFSILQERLKAMAHQSAIPENIFICGENEDLKIADERGCPRHGTVSRIISAIRLAKAGIVMWDPLISFHTTDENDNSKMRAVLEVISYINKKAGASAIIAHHFGKGWSTDEGQRTRGASAIKDWADTLVTLGQVRNSTNLFRMSFRKIRSGVPLEDITLKRGEDFRHEIVDLAAALCPPGRVVEILRDLGGEVQMKKALLEEIEKVMGCCRRTAQDSVEEALRLGVIREKRNGRKISISIED